MLSVAIASFVFLGGMNMISSRNVNIEVSGPVSIAGGQEISFDAIISNNNSTDLDGAKLTVEYPEGVRKEGDLSQDVTSQVFDIGSIASGKDMTQTIKVFVFGKKDEIKKFKLTLDYKVKNSNGDFFKEKDYEVGISSSPIIITSTYPKEINSNREVNFSIEVFPNSLDTPSNMLLHVAYPFGFTYTSSSIAPAYGNDTWKLSGLKQGEKMTINIIGNMVGQDNEERVFKIDVGTPSQDDERQIGVSLVSSNESIVIKKPFIGIDFKVGNGDANFVAQALQNINSKVTLRNNLPEKVYNMVAEVSLSGSAFSGSSVSVNDRGFFRSIDNTIVWDKRSIDKFNELDPGDSQDLSFAFSPIDYKSFSKGSSPEIKIQVKTTADRILESGQIDKVTSIENKTIRLATNLSLVQTSYRSTGNIRNTGFIPPKANNKTTYTISWSVSNSFNVASNVMVSATLPQYVEWTGVLDPSNSPITFDPNTNQVIWKVGQVPAGTGFDTSPKTVMFQVSVLPSTSQINSSPEIVGKASVSGIDKITSTTVESSSNPVTTKFSDFPYRSGDENVVK
jgi:hypothetical protein